MGTALLLCGILMSCTASDDNPEWEGGSIPQCFYDQPIYYQPTQDIQPAEKVGNNIPVYYVRNEQFFIKHPDGRQDDVVPRTAVYASADGGSRWGKNGYYGIEQGYFLYQAEGDGRYWIRFVGPGFAPTEVPPFQPHKIYIVDTQPPAVTLAVSPGPWEDEEKKIPHIYRVGDDITLHWAVEDPYMNAESVRMSTCFAQFPHNLVWSRFGQTLPRVGTMKVTIPPEAADQAGLRFRVEAKDKAGNIGIGMTPVLLVSSMPRGEASSPAVASSPGVRPVRTPRPAQPQPAPASPQPTAQTSAEPRPEDVVPRQPSQILEPTPSGRPSDLAYPYTIAPQQQKPAQASVYRGPVRPQDDSQTRQSVVPRDDRIVQVEQRRAEIAARREQQIAERKDGLVPPADLLDPIKVDPQSVAQGDPTPPTPKLETAPVRPEPAAESAAPGPVGVAQEPAEDQPQPKRAEPVKPRLASEPAPVDPADQWIAQQQPQPRDGIAVAPAEPAAKPAAKKTPAQAPGVEPLAVIERRRQEQIEEFRKAALAAKAKPKQKDVEIARTLKGQGDSPRPSRPAPEPREPVVAEAPQVQMIPAPSTDLAVSKSEPQVPTEVSPATTPKIQRQPTVATNEPASAAPTWNVPKPDKLTQPTEPLGRPRPVVEAEPSVEPAVEPQIAIADKPGVTPPQASAIRRTSREPRQMARPRGDDTVRIKPLPGPDPTAEPAEESMSPAPQPVESAAPAQRPSPARPKRNPLQLQPIDTPRSQPETMGQAPRVNAHNYTPQDDSAVPALSAIPSENQPEDPEPLAIEVEQDQVYRPSQTARDVAINPGDKTPRGDTPSRVRAPTPIARLSDIPESVQQGWPEANMILRGGVSRLLNWIPTHNGRFESMELQFSSDDGDRWTTVARDLRRSRATMWTVPMVNSRQCRLRVVGVSKDRRPVELELSPSFKVETGTWKTVDLSGFKPEVRSN